MRRTSTCRVSARIGIVVAALAAATACSTPAPHAPKAELASLDPTPPIAARDLFDGPGGRKWRPPAGPFRFVKKDTTGVSPGFEVEDASGQRWDVKLGPEARTEVVASRLLWAVGFYQPPTYYVPRWEMTGGPAPGAQQPGRFRPEVPGWENEGTWDWSDNPFVATRELRALYVFMALLNNWDLKTDQNVIYEREHARPRHVYVVRDVGASFGRSGRVLHSKDDVAAFRAEPFIRSVRGDHVDLALRRGYRFSLPIHDEITVADVRWLCGRLAELTPRQWSDAFRAGGYASPEAKPFIARLQEKVQEGLRVASQP